MKKLLALVALSFLLVSLGTPDASAHSQGYDHVLGICSTGNPSYKGQFAVTAGLSGGGSAFKGVQANAYIRYLMPCSGPQSGNGGWSLVNVANARKYTGSGGFVQLGYAEQSCVGAYCQNGFANGIMDFWYTAYDNNGGQIYSASWVNNLDGDTGDRDYPIVGDRYWFGIEERYNPSRWRFCITVLSSSVYSTGAQDCHNITRNSSNYFDEASWAFEVYNDASVIGHSIYDSSINIKNMGYLNYNGSIYTQVTGEDTTCDWYSNYAQAPGYLCSETATPGVISTFDAWTYAHSN